MTDPETAALALEDMAASCTRLAAAVRRLTDGSTSLGSDEFVTLAAEYMQTSRRAGDVFVQWTRDVRVALERGNSALEN